MSLTQALVILSALGGVFFFAVAAIGLIRMPDPYTRSHAVGMMDTLGVFLILAAVALHHGWSPVTAKILFILVLLYLANPTIAHAILRAAYKVKLAPWRGTQS